MSQQVDRQALRRAVIMLAVLLGAILAMTVVNVIYVDHVAGDTERRINENAERDRAALCQVVSVQVDAYRQRPADSPPLTPTGQRVAEALIKLHRDYHCT